MAKQKAKWTTERPHGRSVCIVRPTCQRRKDWQHWTLLLGDAHWDNPQSDHKLIKRHLDEAVERDASIAIGGDWFCAMQGKYDRRASKSKVRPEHQVDDYLDALVRTAADFLEPYADRIVLMHDGNHETAIRKMHETDLLSRLTATLYDRTGVSIMHGGYTCWLRYVFMDKAKGRACGTFTTWCVHGWGGGGPVTLGTIQGANRMPMMAEDFDLLWTQHVHERWSAEKIRVRLNASHQVEQAVRLVCCTSTYKDEYGTGEGGWHVETGKPPKAKGGYWLRNTYDPATDSIVGMLIPTEGR